MVHCAVALLEVELLRGEDLFHQPDEGRLACVARSKQPYEALLWNFSVEEDIDACVNNLRVACLCNCNQTLLTCHAAGIIVNEPV